MEADLVSEILHEFGSRDDCRIWRNNVGSAKTRDGRFIRFGIPGQADISGILAVTLPGGRVIGQRIEIEAKTKTGRQRPEQKKWQAMIERMGGIYILARSVDDVRAGLGL